MEKGRYHILIVDDDPDLLDILNILLTGEGYRVTRAGSGDEALARLDTTVDLIILGTFYLQLIPLIYGIFSGRFGVKKGLIIINPILGLILGFVLISGG